MPTFLARMPDGTVLRHRSQTRDKRFVLCTYRDGGWRALAWIEGQHGDITRAARKARREGHPGRYHVFLAHRESEQ